MKDVAGFLLIEDQRQNLGLVMQSGPSSAKRRTRFRGENLRGVFFTLIEQRIAVIGDASGFAAESKGLTFVGLANR